MGEGEECEAANYVLYHFKLPPEAVTFCTNLLVHLVDLIGTDDRTHTRPVLMTVVSVSGTWILTGCLANQHG
ncbi:unnamed protein product [Dibothriocephalus latus]|uniref:Uncharacterized protein n=1 Tax=Dibothriocephalus latus TaxID=60516 RepID=A0A3P6R410_DIBLA|nr:unnamed protein product [Dibothriocephalus latus]